MNLIKLRGINAGICFQMYECFKANEHEHRQRLEKEEINMVYGALRILNTWLMGRRSCRNKATSHSTRSSPKFKDKKDDRTGKHMPFQ